MISRKLSRQHIAIIIVAVLLVGSGLRLMRAATNDFIFFDEGFYLNYNSRFYDLLETHPPDNWPDLQRAVSYWFRLSLGSGKALWFMISDARFFFGAYRQWFVPKLIAALAGIMTLGLTFLFARRFFLRLSTATLSLALLAVLPSHVFYSRLALQETLSTFFFLAGFYFYLFPRGFGPRTFLSAAMFAGAYFTNYRLILLPIHILACAAYLSFTEKRMFSIRKIVWHILAFVALLVIIGNLDQGQNTVVTFAWMFHQSHLAAKQFHAINFLSYPYYLFRLENFLFGLFFWMNLLFCWRRRDYRYLPFALVCLHMLMYSFAAEKGARYVCVILPFAVMAASQLGIELWERYPVRYARIIITCLALIMFLGLIQKSFDLASARTDYRLATRYLLVRDPNVKVMASQNHILNLYTPQRAQVIEIPHRFMTFIKRYQEGYRYLVIGPQAYISCGQDDRHFQPPLRSFLGFIEQRIKPIKTFNHFNAVLMERFVFEHNENLYQSIRFLKQNDPAARQLRIYDVGQCLAVMSRVIGRQTFDQQDFDYSMGD